MKARKALLELKSMATEKVYVRVVTTLLKRIRDEALCASWHGIAILLRANTLKNRRRPAKRASRSFGWRGRTKSTKLAVARCDGKNTIASKKYIQA
jgi:hypothetical protein